MSEVSEEFAQRVVDVETSLLAVLGQVKTLEKGAERLDAVEKTLQALAKEVQTLRPAKQREKDWVPVAWTDRASREEWSELVAWVDWLRGTYDVTDVRAIPPCWPAHRGLANDLSALHQAWIGAQRADHDKKDHQALIHWHDRWFAPLLGRVHMYGTKQCGPRNHDPVIGPEPTRDDLMPAVGEYVTAAL
ncbi:MAG: hypothetical protein Q4F67_03030 [Propionibacteriaceae bacterium]|nr:hypothetical protein [Propionibacteriaceae bacterium]